MKSNFYIIIVAVILTSLIYACHKEENCTNCETCEDFVYIGRGHLNVIYQKDEQEHMPYFNPNNKDEFIYVKYRKGNYDLIKYTLSSKEETIILHNIGHTTAPKWGKNNLILFVDYLDKQLHIVDSDGQNEQIFDTKGRYVRYPEWKNDSTIVADLSIEFNNPSHFVAINIYTNKMDTIPNIHHNLLYINEKDYLYYFSTGINFVSNNSTKILIENVDGINSIYSCSWHPNNTDIFYTTYNTGLYRINENSKRITKIKNGCDTRFYRYISISPDGKKILTNRVDAIMKDNAPEEDTGIYLMNIDGTDEMKLF